MDDFIRGKKKTQLDQNAFDDNCSFRNILNQRTIVNKDNRILFIMNTTMLHYRYMAKIK